MLSFTHTLISLPFGVYLNHPLIIFVVAFLFHLLSDTLLHWNIFPFHFKRYPYLLVAIDISAGLIAAWMILGNQVFSASIVAAIAGGNMPDILDGLWDILGPTLQKRLRWVTPFFRLHDTLQLETTNFARGSIWQVVLIIAAILLVI